MRQSMPFLLGLLATLWISSPTPADVPRLINYQGTLTDLDGIPLTGDHNLTFALYPDSAQAIPALWIEPHTDVSVDHGLFSVILGGITPIPDSLFAGDECWLGIIIDDPPEIYPRMRFTSVPWALRAAVADTAYEVIGGVGDGHSLNAADGEPVDALYVDDEGRVGIGTTTPDPDTRLDIPGLLQATELRIPTDAQPNYILTSDSLGTATWEPANGGRTPEIRYADMFPGDNAGQMIAAAINDLPETGGIVDARGLSGEEIQVINNNMFEDVTVDVTLLLGSATYLIGVEQAYEHPQWHSEKIGDLRVIGQGSSTILQPTSSITVISVQAWEFLLTDVEFDLNDTNSTAILLRALGWSGALIERVRAYNKSGTSPMIQVGVIWDNGGAPGTVIRDVQLYGNLTSDAIEVRAEGLLVDRCLLHTCKAGVRLVEGTTSTISNSMFWNMRHALIVEGTYFNTTFCSNDCESQTAEEFIRVVGFSPEWPVRAVSIRDNHFAMMRSPATDVIYLKNVAGVVIEGNSFQARFSGSGAKPVIYDGGVSDVSLMTNITHLMGPEMPGHGDVPLEINDVRATQSSSSGGFAGDMTLGGSLSIGDMMRIKPRSTIPENPVEGDLYMDAATHKLMVFDGTVWRACW